MCPHLLQKQNVNISSSSCSTVIEEEYQPPEKVLRPDRALVHSPPSIRLAVPCASTGHSFCFICKKNQDINFLWHLHLFALEHIHVYWMKCLFLLVLAVVPVTIKTVSCQLMQLRKSRPLRIPLIWIGLQFWNYWSKRDEVLR